MLQTGGLFLIDNVFWSGKLSDEINSEEHTVASREFNRIWHQDDRIDLSLLPVADGLTLARKR